MVVTEVKAKLVTDSQKEGLCYHTPDSQKKSEVVLFNDILS